MILFHTPGRTSSVQTGLVLSVWRGVKAPKLICGDVPINCVVAFRAVQLDLQIPPEEGVESKHYKSRSQERVDSKHYPLSLLHH